MNFFLIKQSHMHSILRLRIFTVTRLWALCVVTSMMILSLIKDILPDSKSTKLVFEILLPTTLIMLSEILVEYFISDVFQYEDYEEAGAISDIV